MYVQSDFALDVCRLVIIQEDMRAHVKSVRRDILRVCMMTSSTKYQRPNHSKRDESSKEKMDEEEIAAAAITNAV